MRIRIEFGDVEDCETFHETYSKFGDNVSTQGHVYQGNHNHYDLDDIVISLRTAYGVTEFTAYTDEDL